VRDGRLKRRHNRMSDDEVASFLQKLVDACEASSSNYSYNLSDSDN
jgi:hypothetical protein